ncbi:MAG: acetate kinase, partial [Eubacterium sp.]
REAIDKMLNNESGVLGISGISSDFRDVEAAANAGNERAILALKIFHYRVRTTIGAYVAAMDGVDGIIFTAGLGENSSIDRAEICNGLKYLGITLDKEKNSKRGEPMVITTPESRTKVMVIPTNEELMIARDTVELTSK